MKRIILCLILMLLLGGALEAQQRQTRQRQRPQSTSSARAGSWSRSRATTNRNTANAVPSVSRSPVNVGAPRSPSGWSSPVDPYARIATRLRDMTGFRYQPWDLYYCDLFYSRLLMDFGYLYGRDAFWTYAQGGPAINPEAAQLALQTSTRAADRILAATARLGEVLDQYEAGAIGRHDLEDQAKNLVSEIRQQTKRVRNDYYVDYLDQRKNVKVENVDRAKSVVGLRELVEELRSRALELKQDFDEYFKDERTQVISVEELSQPSFKARSKEIDKLTAAIKKSVVKL